MTSPERPIRRRFIDDVRDAWPLSFLAVAFITGLVLTALGVL